MRLSTLSLIAAFAGFDLCACSTHAFLIQGDEKSAQVGYAGDVASATPIAVKHCAGYGRGAELVSDEMDKAYFACIAR